MGGRPGCEHLLVAEYGFEYAFASFASCLAFGRLHWATRKSMNSNPCMRAHRILGLQRLVSTIHAWTACAAPSATMARNK